MADSHGLFIAGTRIGAGDSEHAVDLARIRVPLAARDNAAYRSGDLAALAGFANPRRFGILAAILTYGDRIDFASFEALDQNVTMRQVAIEVITGLNTGELDADYFDPAAGKIHPRLGSTFFDPDPRNPIAPANGIWKNGPWWQTANFGDPWEAEFDQIQGTRASAAMQQIIPFRGECAGALQVAVFSGAIAALGPDAFDAAHPDGTLQIATWGDDVKVYLQTVDLAAPKIPGDYFYFRNDPRYPKLAPDGFWQGLNCLYVGADQLFVPRYTGLGAVFQAETELRATMKNAFMGDCYPNVVKDPQTDICFTMHARLTLGTPEQARAVAGRLPASAGLPVRPTSDKLLALGFARTEGELYTHPSIALGALAGGLGFDMGALRQTLSAPCENAAHRFRIDANCSCVVNYLDKNADRRDTGALVGVSINLGAA